MPPELILRPSWWPRVLLFAVCAAFAGAGVGMVRDEASGGWFVLLFFGLGTIVAFIQLLPGASCLRLTDTGFSVRTMYRTHSYEWGDVRKFEVGEVGRDRRVVFDFAGRSRKKSTGRAVAKALAGAEGALADNYGRTVEDLARLLNDWKRRSGKGGGEPD
jgi:hypothetical protein